ncbi:MAG: HlyD family efflux transporter periplasmic adaptor subunit [Candidatus Solibacter sp.]
MNVLHPNRDAGVERETLLPSQPGLASPPKLPSPRSPWRRLWLWAGAVAVLVALAVTSRSRPADHWRTRLAVAVATTQVRTGTLQRIIRLTGSTAGENSVTLLAPYLQGSRTRGGGGDRFHLVLQQLIPEGTRVAAGDIVATFDQVSMLERIDDLKADRDQATGNLTVLAARLAADREVRDQKIRVAKAAADAAALDLKTAPVRSAIQADMFRLSGEESRATHTQMVSEAKDFESAQTAQVRFAQLNLEAADLEVRHAEVNAGRMVVRAPHAGIAVMKSTVRNGEYGTIRAGDELHAGQPYLDIVAPGAMIVDATVNQVDVSELRIGATAEITPEAFPDIRLWARVISIGSIAVSGGFRGNFVREVPVRLRITGSDPRLLPSLTVTVDVTLGQTDNVPLVSRAAVFKHSPDGRPFAFVQTPEGWSRRSLNVGLTNHTAVALLSGLQDGDIVAAEIPGESTN